MPLVFTVDVVLLLRAVAVDNIQRIEEVYIATKSVSLFMVEVKW